MMRGELQKDETHDEALPDLFAKLADDVTRLFDAKIALLRVEIREEIDAYVRGGVMMVIGGVVAVVGFALLNVAVAFLIASLFQNTNLSQPVRYAIGFLITALLYLIGGGALIMVSKNKLAAQGIVPKRTVAELKRDREAIENEL